MAENATPHSKEDYIQRFVESYDSIVNACELARKSLEGLDPAVITTLKTFPAEWCYCIVQGVGDDDL